MMMVMIMDTMDMLAMMMDTMVMDTMLMMMMDHTHIPHL